MGITPFLSEAYVGDSRKMSGESWRNDISGKGTDAKNNGTHPTYAKVVKNMMQSKE